jgi:catechol 2,3-dioxygenase-like lactoylglutathione lyase family enzyme
MLDHVDFGTTDFKRSREFYVACLAPLDIHLVMEIERHDATAGRYAANWYAAFVYDPDGHTIGAVYHEPWND